MQRVGALAETRPAPRLPDLPADGTKYAGDRFTPKPRIGTFDLAGHAARVWHVSRPELLAQYWRRLANALLWQGFASIHLETRRAPADLWPTKVRSGFNAKVYRSDTLLPGEIDYLYSESMAMDL